MQQVQSINWSNMSDVYNASWDDIMKNFMENGAKKQTNQHDAEENAMASVELLLATYQAIDDFQRTYHKRPLLADFEYAR